jgi:hypothetical protein
MAVRDASVTGRPPDPEQLLRAIDEAEHLVGHASGMAVALEDLGVDLPAPAPAVTDPAQLRAIAGLYFAAELDASGLISAAESLSSLNSAGGMPFPLGSAAPDVAHFWEGRHIRATADERAALFARLFGADTGVGPADHPGNDAFQTDMIELAEALYKLDEAADNKEWGGLAQQARLRMAAGRVADGLTAAASGLTVFMAQDLLATLRLAFAIFRHADLRLALGARDMWGAVTGALRLARLPATQTALHASRAQAGMTILSWLADAAPHLGAPSGPLVALDHPVISAAVDWLEVSLKIGEAAGSAATPAAPAATPSRVPWAARMA